MILLLISKEDICAFWERSPGIRLSRNALIVKAKQFDGFLANFRCKNVDQEKDSPLHLSR